jgi:hypothetical protein
MGELLNLGICLFPYMMGRKYAKEKIGKQERSINLGKTTVNIGEPLCTS